MKTSYSLATATVLVAAAVAVYAQLPPAPPPPLPMVPLAPGTSGGLPSPGSPTEPLALPSIVADPAATPALPPMPGTSGGLPSPGSPPAAPPVLPTVPPPPPPSVPLIPAPPTVPGTSGRLPSAGSPTPISSGGLPSPGSPPVAPPTLPTAPPPTGAPLPAPTPIANPTKFVVLQDGKLVEGIVTTTDEKVTVRQGAIDRPFKKSDVQFAGDTKDDVYRFLLGKVKPTDTAGRLAVARWCMLNGLRPQALAEAREVAKLQPTNTAAADMVRSLEESLRLYPGDGTIAAVPTGVIPAPNPAAAAEPEADVSAEAATVFAARVQPVLANLCADCHAKADHASGFKLARTTGYDASPPTTRQNLRAAAAQLKKDDPANSPLLVKAVAAHGGMKQPAIAGRQVPSFKALEGWVSVAGGCPPPAVPVMIPPAPVPTAPPPAPVVKPMLPALPVAPPPVIPPAVDPKPIIPVIPPAAEGSGFGRDAKPLPKSSGPNPSNSGPVVDEFDPSLFNRAASPSDPAASKR